MTVSEFGQTIQQRYPQYQGQDPAIIGQKVLQQYPQYNSMVDQPNQSGGGNFLGNMLSSAARPFIQTGKTIGGAAYELGRGADELTGSHVAKLMGQPDDYYNQQTGQAVQNPFVSEQELKQYDQNPLGAIGNQVKNSAGVASWAVPFGRGANLLSRAVLPGVASGVLQGASDPNATAGSVAGSGATGGLGSGLTGTTMKMLGITPVVSKGLAQGMNSVGNAIARSQYNLPERLSSQFNFPQAVQEVANRYGVTSRQKATNMAHAVTGSDGMITDLVNQAVAKTPQVDLGGMYNFVNQALQRSYALPQHVKDNIGAMINSGVNNTLDGKGVIYANPTSTMSLLRTLEEAGADHAQAFDRNGNVEDKQAATALGNIADELRDRTFNGYHNPDTNKFTSGANQQLFQMLQNPAWSEKAHAISPEFGMHFDKVVNDANGNPDVSQIRHLAAPFVAISKANNYASNRTMSNVISPLEFFGAVSQLGADPLRALSFLAAQKAVNSNMSKGALGGMLMRASAALPHINGPSAGVQNGINYGASKVGPLAAQASQ